MQRKPILDSWRFSRLPDLDLDTLRCADLPDAAETVLSLPHIFEENGQAWHGLGLYRRTVETDPAWPALFVEFDAVDQSCQVFIDGQDAGGHQGGYARFRVPVPASAVRAGHFELAVVADNRLNEHVSPHFGDFTVFGGIPRPVSLLICEASHFDYLYYGTEGLILHTDLDEAGNGLLTAEPHAVCGEKARLRLRVLDEAGQEAASAEGSPREPLEVTIPGVRPWRGRAGAALYTVEASLLEEGRLADQVVLRTGFRHVTADGNGLRLNREPCFLRGVARHQDRAGVFTAASTAQIAEDFDIVDEIGANAVRLSHYQHPQAAYDECDRRGILCWAEIPMLKMTRDPALQENALRQLTELILQNIHHPSVYCWGIQNEIAMFRDAPYMHENCRALHGLAHRLDPSRLTACANLYPVPPESRLNGITDLVGYNYYFGWYYGEFPDYGEYLDAFHAARPDTPVGITEYGADANLSLHSAAPKVKDYSEEYQALYHESVYPYLKARPWLWGSFVWNMFDFSSDRRNEGGTRGLNCKGLVTHDRRTRKDAFYYYAAQWSSAPVLHLCGRRYARRATDRVDVKVYTNAPEVTLTVNGRRAGVSENNGNGTVRFAAVPLAPGKNLLQAAWGTLSDEMEILRVDREPESYRLPDTGGGKVTNWFLQAEKKKDCFSVENTAQQILESPQAAAVLREALPELYRVLTEQEVIPLGLTMDSILGFNVKDPEQVQRINMLLQEVPLRPSEKP